MNETPGSLKGEKSLQVFEKSKGEERKGSSRNIVCFQNCLIPLPAAVFNVIWLSCVNQWDSPLCPNEYTVFRLPFPKNGFTMLSWMEILSGMETKHKLTTSTDIHLEQQRVTNSKVYSMAIVLHPPLQKCFLYGLVCQETPMCLLLESLTFLPGPAPAPVKRGCCTSHARLIRWSVVVREVSHQVSFPWVGLLLKSRRVESGKTHGNHSSGRFWVAFC